MLEAEVTTQEDLGGSFLGGVKNRRNKTSPFDKGRTTAWACQI